MEKENVNKIKVSALVLARIERAEADLRDLIQFGGGNTRVRQALISIQAILPTLQAEKPFAQTWVDSGSPDGAA